jgi:hypothetical protein
MIRLFKELYLTGFTLLFRIPGGTHLTKVGQSIAVLTLIEWLFLAGISSWIDMFIGKRLLMNFTKPVIVIAFFALFLANQYFLFIRGHGIKFEHEFTHLKKSKRVFLQISCVLLVLATIAFFICSRLAYRRFFHL